MLGKTEEETVAQIDATKHQFTHSDKECERLYYEAPDDTAYIADTGKWKNGEQQAAHYYSVSPSIPRQDKLVFAGITKPSARGTLSAINYRKDRSLRLDF